MHIEKGERGETQILGINNEKLLYKNKKYHWLNLKIVQINGHADHVFGTNNLIS